MSKSKKAYPNFDQSQNIPGTHDMNKWIQAVKTIYYEENKNHINRRDALNLVTKDWSINEANDFVHWLRFYEEDNHLKYKTAQFWYGNADTGYLLPIKQDPKTEESSQVNHNIDFNREVGSDELSSLEKKKVIEKQRSKIIGRLDSAEKLLRSQEGQLFADKEFVNLLEIIYELKKKIQLVNKVSSSIKLYDDMIVREANKLSRKGFNKAANVLHSLAQEAVDEDSKNSSAIPSPTPPDPPTNVSGSVGDLPMQPTPASTPAPAAVPEEKVPESIKKFLEGLNTGNKTEDENLLDEDTLEVIDCNADLFVDEYDLIVNAQIKPDMLPKQTVPQAPIAPLTENNEAQLKEELNNKVPSKEQLEIKENEVVNSVPNKDFDHMMESIFLNLTIADVVAKFEDIAKFYKTREMPRQLAMADMMLDSLGLAAFFPALSEATNKALEANNYISTRVDDIIAKLRGAMKTRDIDVKNKDQKKVSPEIENARKVLEDQSNKDIEKKQMRKALEEESLKNQMKETPEIEIEEDLKNPPVAPSPKVTPPAKPII